MRRGEVNLEVNFAERLAAKKLLRTRISVPCEPPNRGFADDFRTFLGLRRDADAIRTVDLIIRHDAVLQNESPRLPSFAVVHPLIQCPGDAVAYDVVYLHVNRHRLLSAAWMTCHRLRRRDEAAVIDVAGKRRRFLTEAEAAGNVRIIGSVIVERRHGDVGGRGESGDAAEVMHMWREEVSMIGC